MGRVAQRLGELRDSPMYIFLHFFNWSRCRSQILVRPPFPICFVSPDALLWCWCHVFLFTASPKVKNEHPCCYQMSHKASSLDGIFPPCQSGQLHQSHVCWVPLLPQPFPLPSWWWQRWYYMHGKCYNPWFKETAPNNLDALLAGRGDETFKQSITTSSNAKTQDEDEELNW